MQDGEGDGADDGAGHGLHAAEQDGDQGVDRMRDGHVGGEDAAFGVGEDRAGQAGGGAGDGEGGQAQGADGKADGGGAQGGVAGCAQGEAEGGEEDAPEQQGAADAQGQGQPVHRGRFYGPALRPKSQNAVIAAGDVDPLEADGPGDLGEGKGEHGEVDAGHADDEPADGQGHCTGGEGCQEQAGGEAAAERLGGEGRGIGADAEPGGVAEAGHAAGAHHQVQRGGEQHRDRGFGQHGQQIGADHERRCHRQCEARQACRLQCGAGRADRRQSFRFAAGGGLRFAEQAVRAQHQDGSHHQEHQHQGDLRQQHDAEGLQHADQQGGQEGAAEAAHAADHDDHEGVGDNGQVHVEVGGALRQGQGAAEAGEPGAEREDRGVEHALIHAEGGEHVAVLGCRADQEAPAGAVEQEQQQAQYGGADGDQHGVVEREAQAGDLDRAAQPGGAGDREVDRAPEPERCVLDHQHHAEGGQELEQLGGAVKAAEQGGLQQGADCRGCQCGCQNAEDEELRGARQAAEDAPGDVSAEHEQAAMGEIDHPGDAENHRQAGGDQEQGGGAGQAGEELEEEEIHAARKSEGKAGFFFL